MGGKALKHLGVDRLPHGEYWNRLLDFQRLVKEVNAALDGSDVLQYEVPYEVKGKDSYGDLDVIVCHSDMSQRQAIFELVLEKFESRGYVKNGKTWSFEWQNWQVDFNWTSTVEEMVWQKLWYSHSELSAFVGYVYRFYGFKFGHDNLRYELKYKSSKRDFVITRDYKAALSLLGYSYNPHQQYTMEDVFELACQTEYLPNAEDLNVKNKSMNDNKARFIETVAKYRVTPNPHKANETLFLLFSFDKKLFGKLVLEYLDMVLAWHVSKVRRWYSLNFGEGKKWKKKNAQK